MIITKKMRKASRFYNRVHRPLLKGMIKASEGRNLLAFKKNNKSNRDSRRVEIRKSGRGG